MHLVIDSLMEHRCFLIRYPATAALRLFLLTRPHEHLILLIVVDTNYSDRGACPWVLPTDAIHLELVAKQRLVRVSSVFL